MLVFPFNSGKYRLENCRENETANALGFMVIWATCVIIVIHGLESMHQRPDTYSSTIIVLCDAPRIGLPISPHLD